MRLKTIFKFYSTLIALEHLVDLLQAFDEDDIEKEDLIATLKRLCDQSAFSEIQVIQV